MYKPTKAKRSQIRVNKGVEGERIEEKINRMVNNKESIKDKAPVIYTNRGDGLEPALDIRNDQWEERLEATSERTKKHREMRQGRLVKMDKEKHPEKYKNDKTADAGDKTIDGSGETQK